MSLTLQNLSYQLGKKIILTDITCQIKPGKLTAVMGLNGAGKSTLLRCLSGRLLPSCGNVTLNDQLIQSFEPRERARQIAFVPQDFPTDFPYTVHDFALMGRHPWRKGLSDTPIDNRFVQAALERLKLSSFADRSITTLSGGERQRVLLARALVQDTPILLLDEPANHLDIKTRVALLDLLSRICREDGKTIVAVMHEVRDVAQHFDEAILLKDGRLHFAGAIKEAMTRAHLQATFDMDVFPYVGFDKFPTQPAAGSCGFPNDF